MATERFANNAQTTLALAAGSGDGTIGVADSTGFPTDPQFRIRVGQELLLVTSLAGTTWTVTRGIEDTTAAGHSAGAAVELVLTAGALDTLAGPTAEQSANTVYAGPAAGGPAVPTFRALTAADLPAVDPAALTGPVSIALGGTGAATASGARTNLGAGTADGLATLDSGGKVPVAQLPDAVLGQVRYQGAWNADTNTPTLASGTGDPGDYYVVGTAGSTNLDGITDWEIGDWAVFNGTAWQKIDNSDRVISVAGKVGAVTLVAADMTDITIIGEAMATAADAAAVRSLLGLGTLALQDADSVAITGGVINNLSSLGVGTVNADTVSATTGVQIGTTNYIEVRRTGTQTAPRILSIDVNDAARTLSLTGDATISGTLTGTNTGDQTISLTGDVTGSGTGSFATTIGANKVTAGKMAASATNILFGRSTAGAGAGEEISCSAMARTLLDDSTTVDMLRTLATHEARLAGGRLTLDTDTPVPTTDQISKNVIMYRTYIHDQLALYNSVAAKWEIKRISLPFTSSAVHSVTLSGLITGKNYDVFAYSTGSALTDWALELGDAWTDDTTRAATSDLTWYNGLLVKWITGTPDPTRRYLGTIRTTGTTTTEDSELNRLVWNTYNRVARTTSLTNLNSHNYMSTTVREWNGGSSHICIVNGLNHGIWPVSCFSTHTNASSGSETYVGLRIDSATIQGIVVSAPGAGQTFRLSCDEVFQSGLGFHTCYANERTSASANGINHIVALRGLWEC